MSPSSTTVTRKKREKNTNRPSDRPTARWRAKSSDVQFAPRRHQHAHLQCRPKDSVPPPSPADSLSCSRGHRQRPGEPVPKKRRDADAVVQRRVGRSRLGDVRMWGWTVQLGSSTDLAVGHVLEFGHLFSNESETKRGISTLSYRNAAPGEVVNGCGRWPGLQLFQLSPAELGGSRIQCCRTLWCFPLHCCEALTRSL